MTSTATSKSKHGKPVADDRDEHSENNEQARQKASQQSPSKRSTESKETTHKPEQPAAKDDSENISEDISSAETDDDGQKESKDTDEGKEQSEGHEEDSYAVEGDTENAPLDPDVKQQKFLKTPLPRGQNPSQSQITMRIQALQLRIGPWVGVDRAIFKEILLAEGWDFDPAIACWERNLAIRKTHHMSNSGGRTYKTVLEDKFLSAGSLHQNHRMGIDHVYTSLSLTMLSINPAKRLQLTSLRSALLLIESGWDLDIAEGRCMEIVKNDQERQRFLRRDRRLRMVIGNEPNQLHKDERVALFMELAGTDDHTSAETMVRIHGWDLGVVIDVWMRQGLPLIPYDRKLLRKVTFAAPRLLHAETNSMWPAWRLGVPNLTGIDQADRDDYDLDYEQGAYINRTGWLINYDTVHPLVGLVQPEKMRIEMIRNGEFKVLHYNQKPTAKGTKRKGKSTGEATKAEREEFDWSNLGHINKLVAWRRQPPRRISGELKRSKAKVYHELEDGWIFDWHAAERDRILDGESVEDYRARGGKWPLRYDVKKLFKEFNEEFEGRTDLPGTDGEPHNHRTQAALDARRKRIDAVCTTFGLPFSPPHKKDPLQEETSLTPGAG